MKNLKLLTFILFLSIFFFNSSIGQPNFRFDTKTKVYLHDKDLIHPFAGGINSAQLQMMDLNADTKEDIVLFDIYTNRVLTFIYTSEGYRYAPEFITTLPREIEGFFLLADYNGDGKKDIFTHTLWGIKVFKNCKSENKEICWEKIADPIYAKSGNRYLNLMANIYDIPAVTDLDKDGDCDILLYNPSSGQNVLFYKNVGLENCGSKDSLVFELMDYAWAGFKECSCEYFSFNNVDCFPNTRLVPLHVGGKQLLFFDLDGDNDEDILAAHEGCNELYVLKNDGNPGNYEFNSFISGFPVNDTAVDIEYFPSGYFEDINKDGKKDFIASPHVDQGTYENVNFKHSLWLYEYEPNGLKLRKRNFLQEEMIDFGSKAVPLFFDKDQDGDQDLLIAISDNPSVDYFSSILFLENTGSARSPEFFFRSDDFLNISSLYLKNLSIAMADANNDGLKDLVFTGNDSNSIERKCFYYPQIKTTSSFYFDSSQIQTLPLTTLIFDFPYFYDINNDGYLDVLIGKYTGRVEYYENNKAGIFILKEKNFLGIKDNSLKINPRPTIGDINKDGQKDMVICDASGVVQVFYNISSRPKAEKIMVQMETSVDSTFFGSLNVPVIAEIYQQPGLMFGSSGGGVILLESVKRQDDNIIINLFPNPASEKLKVILKEPAEIVVFELNGKEIGKYKYKTAEKEMIIDTRNWTSGVYLFKVIGETAISIAKVVVN